MAFWMHQVVKVALVFENYIVARILRSPGFHNVVRKIHRKVQDRKYGRDPHEPLRPGEATELHGANSDNSFMKHFIQELRNQARGTPTDPPPSSSVRPPRK